jgi:fibronectin-binding autotransporter adhesin
MKPNRSLIPLLGARLGIITVSMLGAAGLANAQTWTNTTTGTSNWSTGSNWDTNPAVPASASTTAVKFFATPGTVIPAASAVVANQDIAAPMILNSLTVNGTGPGSGAAPSLTVSGGAIQFAGTSPALDVNAGYGTVGYTVNLNSNLDFSADTAINFSGGGFINTGGAWNGSGAVTFTGSLGTRPLSLTTATGTTFTGDLFLAGNSNTVLQLNGVTGALGANAATTQAVVVNNNAGVNINYGNGAFNNQQNFVISGNGNASTSNAAVNITRINFGNCTIGGLATAADSTFRLVMENAGDARVVSATRGLVGSGKLIKTGNGYFQPSVTSPAGPVSWGGTAFSAFTGDVEVRQGALQTPANQPNSLGPNTATTQRVTVSSGAALVFAAGNNASTQPQNFILNGNGTGYAANVGGLAALDSYGAGFGNNTLRRIVLASDAAVSVRRDVTSTGSQYGLIATSGLSGAGNLTVGSNYGQPISPLYLNVASTAFAEFPAFSGKVIINNGILNIGNIDALGTSTTGQVTLSSLGTLSSSIASGLDQAFFDRIANLSTTSGTIALGATSTNDLDFTTAPNARLGAIASYTYSGNITPAGSTYRLGGGGGTLTVSSQLTDGNSLVITGGVVLSNPSNDFTGGITIAGNNTGLGQGATLSFTGGVGSLPANPISFGGAGGTIAYTGAPAGSTHSLGALAFTTGHATVSSTYGTSGNTALSYTSLTRSAGATGNFATANSTSGVTANSATDIITAGATAVMADGLKVTFGGTTVPAGLTAGTQYFVVSASGNTYQVSTTLGGPAIDLTSNGTNVTQTVIGTNGTTNKISIAGLATGFVNKGVFFGDFNYAYNDAAGFLRAPAYGTDAGFVTSGTTTSVASATHQNISGALTAQNNVTFTTLKIAGNFGVALATDQVMTVDGILKSGGGAGTISGSGTLAGIKASSGSEMVVRPYSSGDNLTISTPILANGASSLTKSGAGTLTLTAANTYTGVTTVAAGTLTVSGSGSLEDTSPVTITGGTYNVSVNDTVGAVTLKNGVIGSTSILTGTGYDVENGTISARLAGTGALTKSSSGQVILSGVNTYEGGTSITGGTLAVTGAGRLYDSGDIAISGGGIYDVGGPDTVGVVTLANGTIRGAGALNAASYAVEQGTISAPLAGTGTITKSTGGTVTLAGVNTAVSDVVVNSGTLALADNAKLNFAINGLFSNSITGTGTVTLDGDFGIDLSLADLTPGNTWTLVDAATLTKSFGANFSIPGFTETANVWTKVDGLNKWTFTEATGVLKLSLAGFSSWITGFGLAVGDQDPEDDPDFDGINNLMEYVLFNGHPNMPSTSIVPTLDASGANFVFTFYRRNDSTTDTAQIFQYATDLNVWTPVAIPGGAGVTVTPDTPSLGIDKVEISVVKGANPKLFGRLKVTQL